MVFSFITNTYLVGKGSMLNNKPTFFYISQLGASLVLITKRISKYNLHCHPEIIKGNV